MIQDPLLITNATKIWVEIETCQNSSREKKERKFDDGHEPASYRKQD
jgi:hypothetical protein